jgi:chemotaxis-related protein WspB
MLMLLFQAGTCRYALDSQQIVEVLPWASLYPASGGQGMAQNMIAGLLNYHGQLVSVIDLGQLIHDMPSRRNYGSRIILINAAALAIPGFETAKWLGLLADRVVDTQAVTPDMLVDTGESSALYLGRAIVQDQTLIRCFHPEGLDLRTVTSPNRAGAYNAASVG